MAALERELRIDKIDDCVFVGSWSAATDEQNLEENDIKAVLSISENKKPPNVLDLYNKFGILSYEIRIENVSNEDFYRWFPRMFAIINHFAMQKANILVHCSDGNCRAIVAITAYEIIKAYLNPTPKKSPICTMIMQKIQELRDHVSVPTNFTQALQRLEREIREKKYDLLELAKVLKLKYNA
jgi:protein tyrosine phosphatase